MYQLGRGWVCSLLGKIKGVERFQSVPQIEAEEVLSLKSEMGKVSFKPGGQEGTESLQVLEGMPIWLRGTCREGLKQSWAELGSQRYSHRRWESNCAEAGDRPPGPELVSSHSHPVGLRSGTFREETKTWGLRNFIPFTQLSM